MFKVLVLYPKPSDPAKFKSYYVEKHIPLLEKMPHITYYSYSFDAKGPGGDQPYFCVFECEFDSIEDLIASQTSEVGQKVAADGVNYTDAPPTILIVPMKPRK
jgi:uncharacterized protein (TIGR02118 family)